jgi:hypothetical protein
MLPVGLPKQTTCPRPTHSCPKFDSSLGQPDTPRGHADTGADTQLRLPAPPVSHSHPLTLSPPSLSHHAQATPELRPPQPTLRPPPRKPQPPPLKPRPQRTVLWPTPPRPKPDRHGCRPMLRPPPRPSPAPGGRPELRREGKGETC